MFNDFKIEYFEPETKEIRGKINLKHVLKIDLVDDNKWIIEISGRVYKFKVFYADSPVEDFSLGSLNFQKKLGSFPKYVLCKINLTSY